MAWRRGWAGVKLFNGSGCKYPASPSHNTHQYWQPTSWLLPPLPLTFTWAENWLQCLPKWSAHSFNWNLQAVLSHFFLKFQIHNIYRTPFIQLLDNFVDGKKQQWKSRPTILHPPIKVSTFCSFFSYQPGFCTLPIVIPVWFSTSALEHREVIKFD